MTESAEQAADVVPKNKHFEMCSCGSKGGPHAYYFEGGQKMPAIIISVRAGNYLIGRMVENEMLTDEEKISLPANLNSIGLPAQAENDIELLDASMNWAIRAMALERALAEAFGLPSDRIAVFEV